MNGVMQDDKEKEKKMRDEESKKEGKLWRHSRELVHFIFLTCRLFGEDLFMVSGLGQMEGVTAVTHSRAEMKGGGFRGGVIRIEGLAQP